MRKELASAVEVAKMVGKYAINTAVRLVDPRTILEYLTPEWRFKVININDGEIADIKIVPHRDFGVYPGGVAVRLARETNLGKLRNYTRTLGRRYNMTLDYT